MKRTKVSFGVGGGGPAAPTGKRVAGVPRGTRIVAQALIALGALGALGAYGCGSDDLPPTTLPEDTESPAIQPWPELLEEFEYLNNLEEVERRRRERVLPGPPVRDPFRFAPLGEPAGESGDPPVPSEPPEDVVEVVQSDPVEDTVDVPRVIGVVKTANDRTREFAALKHGGAVYITGEGGAFGDGYRLTRLGESTASLERRHTGNVERITVPR